MRILILHDRISERGGSDRYLLSVLEMLQARAETLLLVAQDDGSLPEEERPALGRWVRVKGLDRRGFRPKGLTAVLRAIEAEAEAFAPDVIHVHNVLDPEVMALALSLGPTVMTVQDHRVFCPGQGKIKPNDLACGEALGENCLGCFRDPDYGRRIIELTRRRLELTARMDRVVVLSNYMAGELIAGGVERGKIAVIPPFVHRLEIDGRAGPGEYHLLAGRLVRRKGVRVALEAAARLETTLPLMVAGDGPMRDEVAAAARRSGGKVRYLGWVHRDGMAELLTGARSVWLPSLWAEPFGLIGLEALAAAAPVIAANVGGVSDWLEDGRSGFLVRPGKAAALAAAADRLAAESELALALGRFGRREATRRFGPDRFIEALMAVYASLRRGGRAGRGA